MFTNMDTRMALQVARDDPSLTLGDRMVLVVLLLHAETYEAADPVAWIDKREIASYACMTARSVKNSMQRMRRAGYLAEPVHRDHASGWRQYGTRLGPLLTSPAPSVTTVMLENMKQEEIR